MAHGVQMNPSAAAVGWHVLSKVAPSLSEPIEMPFRAEPN